MNQSKEGKEKMSCCGNQFKVKIDFNFKLGEGGYAKVYKGSLYQVKDGNEIVIPIAVKRTTIKKTLLPNQKEIIIKLTHQEIQILKQAIHPNIVKIYGSCHHIHQNEEFIDIYLELCECNLKEYITSMSYFSESVVLDIFCKILQVTQYLCQLRIMSQNQQYYIGIYHRDLNMKNILVKGHMLKLTDFGLAKPKPKDNIIELSTRRGTPIYMSPENFQKEQYDLEKNDVWSMGVLLYQLLYGYTEFKPQDAHDNKLKFPNSKHPQLQELLQKHMLCEESKRYDFTQLSQHLNSIHYNFLDNNSYTIEDTFQIRLNLSYELYKVRLSEYQILYRSIEEEMQKYEQKQYNKEYTEYISTLKVMQMLLFETFYGFHQSKSSQHIDRYITSNLDNCSPLNELISQTEKYLNAHLLEYSKDCQKPTNFDLEPLGYLYLLNELFKQTSLLKLQFKEFQENVEVPQQFKKFMEWRKRKLMYKEEIFKLVEKQYKKFEQNHEFFVDNDFLKLRKSNRTVIELFQY